METQISEVLIELRKTKRHLALLQAFVALLFSCFLLGSAFRGGTISCSKLVVTDSKGNARVVIGEDVLSEGDVGYPCPGVFVKSQNGATSAALVSKVGGYGELQVLDGQYHGGVVIGTDEDLSQISLRRTSKQGEIWQVDRIDMYLQAEPNSQVFRLVRNRKPQVELKSDAQGASVKIFQPDKSTWKAP